MGYDRYFLDWQRGHYRQEHALEKDALRKQDEIVCCRRAISVIVPNGRFAPFQHPVKQSSRGSTTVNQARLTPAPFLTPDGMPYLGPHHIRRLSDGGPGHPLWVIAVCANCHRRAHYSSDAVAFNQELQLVVEHIEGNHGDSHPKGRS
jgi:hypothetical protein